jgi:hypothetical protein
VSTNMNCKYKNKKGESCKWSGGSDKDIFCYVHNPELLPLFFVKNYGKYKKNDIKTSLSIKRAQLYIDRGVAIRIDEKVRRYIDKSFLKAINNRLKSITLGVKKNIAENDVLALAQVFGDPSKAKPGRVDKFIQEGGFTKKEQNYLRMFVEQLSLVLKNNGK